MTDLHRKLAELEAMIREQDEAHEARQRELRDVARQRELRDELNDPRVRRGTDAYLAPAADAISGAIIRAPRRGAARRMAQKKLESVWASS